MSLYWSQQKGLHMDAKKMMLVIGGDHNDAQVEVEDYTFAVRLPLPFTNEELQRVKEGDVAVEQRYALYYRASIRVMDDDGLIHQIEFLRPGSVTVRQALESRLTPQSRPLT